MFQHASTKRQSHATSQRAAVLLEVVLALVLFAAAAVVIGIALNSSMASVDRLRLATHAADLSVTVFSELQLGTRSASGAPVAQENTTNVWTVEIVTQPWGDPAGDASSSLTDVEVILRHESGFVHRARQVMKLSAAAPLSL